MQTKLETKLYKMCDQEDGVPTGSHFSENLDFTAWGQEMVLKYHLYHYPFHFISASFESNLKLDLYPWEQQGNTSIKSTWYYSRNALSG